MATDERLPIEGIQSKPYRLYRVHNREIIEQVSEADTLEEIRAVRRRGDWSYAIYYKGKRIEGAR